MTSSESEERGNPKKRSKPTANGADGNVRAKKARGRPRVETTESRDAGERRRTQIRLAQRAYRQRKETTISSLKKSNFQLQQIVDQMNKAFTEFYNSVVDSDVVRKDPLFAHHLNSVGEIFLNMSKTAAAVNLEVEDDQNGEMPVGQEPGSPPTTATSLATRLAAQSQKRSHPDTEPMDIGWGYTTAVAPAQREDYAQPQSDDQNLPIPHFPNISASSYDTNTQSSIVPARRPTTSTHHLPFGLMELLSSREQSPYPNSESNSHIFTVNIPPPAKMPPLARLSTPTHLGIPNLSLKNIPALSTYSYQETTFARRLTRAALESAHELLSQPNTRPAAIDKVFKLSLPYMTIDDIRERISLVLSRGTQDELDFWQTPFIHLGGAGTHFPRKDAHGNEIPVPNAWTVRRIGPIEAKMVRAVKTDDPSQTYDMKIDLSGMDGEWFDAHDVQGYLEAKKGCYINPRDQHAAVRVPVDEGGISSIEPEQSNIVFARQPMDLDISGPRRGSDNDSDSPSVSNASSSTDSNSAQPTTPQQESSNGNFYNHLDATFGLDMAFDSFSNNNVDFQITEFPKFPDIDPSTALDAPLGLDLAPGFDSRFSYTNMNLPTYNFPSSDETMGSVSLGLDLMGGSSQTTNKTEVIGSKQEKTKLAHVNIDTLVQQLILHGVCLGRAPGFRKKDVDTAFQFALQVA